MVKEINNIRDWVFRQVHTKNLVYNTCWEDPRCDRELLELDENSEMVMITSAGCNALDYLLDDPAAINCIDMNPRQNSLLQLKLATINNTSYEDLWQLFGTGKYKEIRSLYDQQLRPNLPDYAQKYWDKHLSFFNGKGIRKSFYYYSTSGTVAWMAKQYMKTKKKTFRKIEAMFNANSLEEQTQIYNQIEEKVMTKLVQWVMNRHITMSLVGVPRAQQKLFIDKYEQGAMGFAMECFRKVFTQLPLKDNYFYRVYLQGEYTKDCCPSYLVEDHFEHLRANSNRVQTHTTTMSQFLKDNPKAYSHYVLLDHQDWLAEHDIPALEEEWRLILENSRPGTRILMRSAAHEIDFFPDFVLDKVTFEQEKTRKTHQEDRVGTYASVYLGIVK